ncbi:hypothetical protein [Bradyrhizobium sp. Ash2021]|uniref:hypothetical protein n=1 Tax=Bradyrhizobium sp. Ash2021 TaxID=2954771 RepID=UPI002814EF22|nr:hypothetical protein [Bradyrhizobium sp. Ash2021]WMT76532.1 hypothetical protein NL528_09290 [Bradyrhizobium sp. Ash2021]
MAIPPRRLARRVAFLLRQREHLRSQAAAFVLRYYRKHRRLPAGYVTTLLPSSTVRRIRLRGEIEHMLRISRTLIKLEDILS